jgi:hypothetical protein
LPCVSSSIRQPVVTTESATRLPQGQPEPSYPSWLNCITPTTSSPESVCTTRCRPLRSALPGEDRGAQRADICRPGQVRSLLRSGPSLVPLIGDGFDPTLKTFRVGRVKDRRGSLGPAAVTPFPIPAHRTGRAELPHPALRLASLRGPQRGRSGQAF